MNKLLKSTIVCAAMATMFMLSANALASQAGAAKDAKSKAPTTATANPAVSDKDIADAKAKGLVWVNLNTKVYHKDGQFYGKTKQGQFMTEADAQKAGYRAAKPSAVSKKKTSDSKK